MRNFSHRVAHKFANDFLGCELVPSWRMERLAQTAYLKRLIDAMGIDCIFDVGANHGQYRDYLRQQVGYSGLIISFEPNPDCSTHLTQLAASDRLWKVMPIALGETAGTLDFNIMKDSQFSSFLTPKSSALWDGGKDNVVTKVVSVEVSTLAEVYPALLGRFQFARPFLKIDTQGYELQVIRGGAQILSGFVAAQAEVSNVPIYDGISGMTSVTELMSEFDFHFAHIFPTNPDHFPMMVDFDAYFINCKKYE